MVVTLPECLDAGSLPPLAEELERAESPVVVVGAGEEIFCRGLRLHGLDEADYEAAVGPFLRVVRALRTGPAAIAFVDGDARGAGLGIAAACDLVIATPRARFGLSELWFGLWPAAIHPILAERMSVARLRWLAITGRSLDVEEAMHLGLVDRGANSRDAVEVALAEIRRAEPQAVRRYKSMTAPLDAVAEGARTTLDRLAHPEVQRRMKAFSEGLAPWP